VALFPLFVELEGRPCVVLGGGAVAERKVEGLLAAGAVVTVVSPALSPALATLASAGRIAHVARSYTHGDLRGAALAFAATDDGGVNAAVALEGRARGVWVNAADDPAHCDAILPAVVRRGAVTVAVSTGGASPALARACASGSRRRCPTPTARWRRSPPPRGASCAPPAVAPVLRIGWPRSTRAWTRCSRARRPTKPRGACARG